MKDKTLSTQNHISSVFVPSIYTINSAQRGLLDIQKGDIYKARSLFMKLCFNKGQEHFITKPWFVCTRIYPSIYSVRCL